MVCWRISENMRRSPPINNPRNQSEEDNIVGEIIEVWEQHEDDYQITPEAHYNHYGDRGVADLCISNNETVRAFEIKSKSSLKNVTGANEVIRQYNRMVKYLPKDGEWDADHYHFRLVFENSYSAVNHVYENWSMYKKLNHGEVAFGDMTTSSVSIYDEGALNKLNEVGGPPEKADVFHYLVSEPTSEVSNTVQEVLKSHNAWDSSLANYYREILG